MKRVIVLGKGEVGIKVANWFLKSKNHDLTLVIPDMPEPNWSPSITNWCKENKIPYDINVNNLNNKDFQIDLAVSIFYGKILKEWFINKCNQIINLHNGPLPRYRGVSPINWALKNGENEHGVTIHQITSGIDDGPIYSQTKFSIHPDIDEVQDVLRRCYDFGWLLFQHTIENLDQIAPQQQNEEEALYYSKSQQHLLGDRKDFTRKQSGHV